jgi:hypothetical protein
MYNDVEQKRAEDDLTIPARPASMVVPMTPMPEPAVDDDMDTDEAPWLLQLHFDGEINLDEELSKRYSNMPVMSIIHFRTVGKQKRHGLASLSSQDGAAAVTMEVDPVSRAIHCRLTLNSSLSLVFQMEGLSDRDRARWQQVMRAGGDELAFLWGETRWHSDYLVGASHKFYTNIYAFSPLNMEGAFRMTPEVNRKLLDWLQSFWTAGGEKASKLNTW